MPPIFLLAIVVSLFSWRAKSEALAGIPTVNFSTISHETLTLSSIHSIVVDEQYQYAIDNDGLTLIPPTLSAFAHLFATDMLSVTGMNLSVKTGFADSSGGVRNSIFLTLTQNVSLFLDAAGRNTSEGYTLTVTKNGVVIGGASPLGVWWGTRTLLQQAKLGNKTLPIGSGSDSPGWGTRGVMLDGGRHYYPPSFIISLCSYLSFFKQITFHLHLSDNNVDVYGRERSLDLYAAFRLNSNDSAVAGLVKPWRANETYSREDFDDIQQQCASRGVTIVPEIESPGHALVIAQWKPELGLSDLSLLNITYPETIPTMQGIWRTFLPWFHSKVVHIGADEYDSTLADDYNFYVNTMASFIANTSNKKTRIWGTNEPGNHSAVDASITVQHWEFFEDNPLNLIEEGYSVLNSDDSFYIVGKWSASYPQALNITRIFEGNPAGGAWAPYIFDVNDPANNPPRDNPQVVGHIAAQWNDYGMNATTFSEAWYSWRSDLAALADKQWGGVLTLEQYNDNFETLHSIVPGQNLDKIVPSKTTVILQYDLSSSSPAARVSSSSQSSTIQELSGNGYDGTCSPSPCNIRNGALIFSPEKDMFVSTPLATKGRNYTLSFSIKISSSPIGSTLFTGADSILQHGNGTVPNVMLITSVNQPYALNYTLPTDLWMDVKLIGRGNATFLSVSDGNEMEFLSILGVDGDSFVWKEIAIEAPIAKIGGAGFVGSIANVTLLDFAYPFFAVKFSP